MSEQNNSLYAVILIKYFDRRKEKDLYMSNQMPEEYSRLLKKPEARHRYWHIQKAGRDFFPESDSVFKLKLDELILKPSNAS